MFLVVATFIKTGESMLYMTTHVDCSLLMCLLLEVVSPYDFMVRAQAKWWDARRSARGGREVRGREIWTCSSKASLDN